MLQQRTSRNERRANRAASGPAPTSTIVLSWTPTSGLTGETRGARGPNGNGQTVASLVSPPPIWTDYDRELYRVTVVLARAAGVDNPLRSGQPNQLLAAQPYCIVFKQIGDGHFAIAVDSHGRFVTTAPVGGMAGPALTSARPGPWRPWSSFPQVFASADCHVQDHDRAPPHHRPNHRDVVRRQTRRRERDRTRARPASPG